MPRHRGLAGLVVLATAAALVLSACSSSKGGSSTSSSNNASSGSSSSSSAPAKTGYNAAVDSVTNPSTKTGGTLRYEISDAPDSFDPGNTYYGFVWNFSLLYARPLITFDTKPGDAGLKLVPDAASALGKVSADGLTWTYTLRPGLKYQDGTAVKSADVKYAIERSNYAPDVFANGPTYFKANLVDNTPPYQGPYKDKSADGLKSIQTPDDSTIVFTLAKPFAEFDYLLANPQSAPVPQAKDTGASYVNAIQSTGPYMFKSYEDGKSAVLVRNPSWSKDTDPLRNPLPDEIDVKLGVEQSTIDQDLLAGTTDMDLSGAGVLAASQPAILTDPEKKKNADAAVTGTLTYMAINETVAPLDNIDCRKAVEYAVDKQSVQSVLGGPVRGAIANQLLPPSVTGYQKIDPYPSTNGAGDIQKAKDELSKCGQPNGFNIALSARSDRPNEINTATAIQASLKKVGINATIVQYPSGKYYTDFAGSTAYAKSHNIGLILARWSADWPTGYGFLDQLLDGTSLKPAGNTNLSYLNDPAINKLFADGITNTDSDARAKIWSQIDAAAMDNGAIVPLVNAIDLLIRPPSVTNVYVAQAWNMYDYLTMGVS
jgi:peptide/nickel transport system substrate-binding protein